MSTSYILVNSADPSVLDKSSSGDFTVQLGRTHIFTDDSEVYLSEAVIPFTWHNVTQENNKLIVMSASGVATPLELTPAYYESIPILVKGINAALKAASLSSIKITTELLSMKVTIDSGTATVQGPLLHMMGWPKNASIKGKITAPKMADITGGESSLYVLIDCIENTTAGSFNIPLLKKLEVGREDRPGDLMHYRAHNPVEVHRLNQNNLMHIGVTIKDSRNKVIDFNGFSTNLTLGIRPIIS